MPQPSPEPKRNRLSDIAKESSFFNTHLRLSLTVPCSLVMPTGIVRAHFVCQRLPGLVAKKNQSERRFSLDTGNRWASEWVKCCYWGAHTIYWIADPASQTSTAQQRQQLLSALTWGYSQSTPSPKRLLLGFRSSSPCTSFYKISQWSLKDNFPFHVTIIFSKNKRHLIVIGQKSEFPQQGTRCNKKSQSKAKFLPNSISSRSKNSKLQQLVRCLHSAQKWDFVSKFRFKSEWEALSLFFFEMKPFAEPGFQSNYIMDALHILAKQQSILICNLLTTLRLFFIRWKTVELPWLQGSYVSLLQLIICSHIFIRLLSIGISKVFMEVINQPKSTLAANAETLQGLILHWKGASKTLIHIHYLFHDQHFLCFCT